MPLGIGHSELELQKALVDRPQVPDFERFVVDEDEGQCPFVLVPGEPVDGEGQVTIGNFVLGQETSDALVPALALTPPGPPFGRGGWGGVLNNPPL